MIDDVRRSGSRSVSLVVGFASGGSADILARLLAQKLGDSLKQPVLVDSRPGAGATIATVAAAKPDGYTLLLATSGHAGSSTLYLGLDIPSSALPHIKSGELRPVAVTTRMRLSVLPAAVVDRLNQDGNAVLKNPDTLTRLQAIGIESAPGSPADFGRLMTEWSIGEAVGTLAAFSLGRRVPPRGVRANPVQGVLLAWPRFGALTPTRRVGHRTAGQ